jgi:hypothetical protein
MAEQMSSNFVNIVSNFCEMSKPIFASISPYLSIKSTWAKSNAYFLVLLFFCQFSAFAQCFLPPVQLNPSTTSRKSITVGDFNNDGNLDFVTANNFTVTTSVSLFRGNGIGGFSSPTNFSTGTGSQAHYVVAADFNGDGWLDIATANWGNATFSVLLNNQVGGFSPFTAYATGTNPRSLALGDFNNDSILDIAVANYNSNSLSVRLGDGLGGFGGSVTVPTAFFGASNPNFVISHDFNRDGNADLAVTMYNGSRVLIFEGNGTGNFPNTPRSYSVGTNPNSIISNDFNNDGLLDLVVANQNGLSISVLLGIVNAPFFGARTNYPAIIQPTSLTSGDFNGDGILDIALAAQGSISPTVIAGGMSVFIGTGSGTFLPRTDFAPNSGARPQGIAAVDFNGDGLLDIATANDATNPIDRGISIFRAIAAPTLPVLNVVQPTCLAPTATITVIEQNVGDSYSFNNGAFGAEKVFDAAPGTYPIRIQNSNGCLSPIAQVIIDPVPTIPAPTLTNVIQPNCANTDGGFEVVVQDITDTHSVDGTTFQASNIFTGLASGSYSVRTKSLEGCISQPTVIMLQPPAPINAPSVTNVIQPDCSNTNGGFEVVVQDITDTYSNDDTTFQASNIFTGLASGSYSVVTKNQLGCVSLPASVTLQVTGTLVAPIINNVIQPTCEISSGSIEVKVQNPNDQYSFNGGITFQTSEAKSDLGGGTYGVQIKNEFGCLSSIVLVTINPPLPIPSTPVVTRNVVNCVISLVVAEQFSTDTYSRNGTNFQISNTFNAVTPGTYTISIKNNAECIASTIVVVAPITGAPDAPTLTTTQPTCLIALGSVVVTVPTADPPYTFSFDNGATFQTNNANTTLAPRDDPYFVVIKSNAGCTSPASSATIFNAKPEFTVRSASGSDIDGTIAITCDQIHPDILFRSENNAQNVKYFWTVSGPSNISGASSVPFNQAIEASAFNLSLTSSNKQTRGFAAYRFRAITEDGCRSDETRTVNIAVDPKPILVARRGGIVLPSASSLTICANEALVLDFSNSFNVASTNYPRVPQNVTNISNAVAGASNSLNQSLDLATGNMPGSVQYIIKAEASGCESDATTVDVTVNPVPVLQTNGSSQAFCEGGPTNITLSNPNNVSNTGYRWSSLSTGLSGASNQSSPITATSIQDLLALNAPGNSVGTVSYSIQAVASGCNSLPASVEVTVNPVPDLQITAPPQICNGNNLTISLSGNLKNINNTFYDWRWVAPSANLKLKPALETSGSTFGTIQQILDLNNNNNGSASLTYEITPKAGNCSGTTVTRAVVVNANPTLAIGPSYGLCSNAPFTFPLSSVGGAPTALYRWNLLTINNVSNVNPINEGATLVETLNSSDGINSGTAIYEIRSVSANACPSEPAYTVASVAPRPIFTLQNNAQIICSGTRTNILFNTAVPGSQLLLKSINYNGVIGGAVTPGVSRFVNAQTLDHILINNSNSNLTVEYEFEPLFGGCVGSVITTSVTVIPALKIDLTVGNSTVCSGTPLRINFSSSNGTSAIVNEATYGLFLTGGTIAKGNEFKNGDTIFESLLNNSSTSDQVVTYTFDLKNGICNTEGKTPPIVRIFTVLNKESRLSIKLVESQVCEDDNTKITPEIELESGGDVQSYEWKFGDGFSFTGSSSLGPVNHKFSSIGTYQVSLDVVSNFGCTGSFSKSISIFPVNRVGTTKQYFEDFEQVTNGWATQKFDLANKNDLSWIQKVPDGQTIKGQSNAWWTGRNYSNEIKESIGNQLIKRSNSYYNNENSALNSPCFFIEKSGGQMVSFRSFVDLQDNVDGVVLQYTTDDINWKNVGLNREGWNWYRGIGITARPGGQNTGPFGWSGNSTRGWRTAKFSLDDDALFGKNVRFRFAFASDVSNPPIDPNNLTETLDGFALDDFFIGNKERRVLVEQLTNYNSDFGREQNEFIDILNDAQPSLVSNLNRISYHVNFPSPDSLNQSNPEDPAARSAFYGISSTATSIFNGLSPLNIKLGVGQLSVVVDSLTLKESLFDLKLEATNGTLPSQLNLTLLLEAKDNFNSPLLAHVALVDNEIGYGVGANAKKLRNVLRKLLLGGDGRLINQSWTKGQTLSIFVKDVELDVRVNNPNKLSLIAFLQDKNTKEVYQSSSISAPKITPLLVTNVEEERDSRIYLFPNPASKQFNFSYSNPGDEWTLVNQVGSVVQSGKAIETPNQLNAINIENLPNGVYFFRLKLKNQQDPVVKKLVVLN